MKSLLMLTTLGVLLWGCYPAGPEYVEELDLVYTNHNDDYDFASKGTYARPDEIVKLTGSIVDGNGPEFIPDIYAAPILATFDENMAALGWTKVDPDLEDPDIIVLPGSLESTTIVYWYDYWYWWGYYPPGGGWYPGYPSYPTVSSYSTGTLLFFISDPKLTGTNGDNLIQWSFAANGLLTGSYDIGRLKKAIDQGFKQSPYLKTN